MNNPMDYGDDAFLAYVTKYGWIVVKKGAGGWTGYYSVPGRYSISEKDIIQTAPLPQPAIPAE